MFKRCYLDYNAATPMQKEAYQALIDNLEIYANPFSNHKEGFKAKKILENSRSIIATNLNVKDHNIIFTSGASEAAASLLTPFYMIGKQKCYMSKLYVGATEHPSVLNGGQFNIDNITKIKVLPDGLIDINDLEKSLAKHNLEEGLPLVAIQAANSETGVLQNITELAQLVHKYKGLFVVDIAQILGKEFIDLNQYNADFYIISAHKLGGPKNIGAFIAASDIISPMPLIKGSQEKGRRGGTQSVALCASFATALQCRLQNLAQYNFSELRNYLEERLYTIDHEVIIYGKESPRLSNTSYFRFTNIDSQTLQMALDLEGFAVSAGSACSSGKINDSHVLNAMGEKNISAIRVSLGEGNNKKDIDNFILALKKILQRK